MDDRLPLLEDYLSEKESNSSIWMEQPKIL